MLIADLVVDGGAPMAVAVTKGEGVAASDEGMKWVPKLLGRLTLMCPGLSGFRIWEPGGLSHMKEIIDQNSGSSGVVLKEDSSLLAMLQILLKILVGWTMMRHLPLWVLPHIILSVGRFFCVPRLKCFFL